MILRSLLAATPAAAAAAVHARDTNVSTIPITYQNNTPSINISIGTPPQVVPVELSLDTTGLQAAAFDSSASSSFNKSASSDDVTLGGYTLQQWEIRSDRTDSGLGGKISLNSMNSSYSVLSNLAGQIPDNTIRLSISPEDQADGSSLSFGIPSGEISWWNPTEALGLGVGWSFIIEGIAVNGEVVELPTSGSTSGSSSGGAGTGGSAVPPRVTTDAEGNVHTAQNGGAAKRQDVPTPTDVAGTSPTAPPGGNPAECIICTQQMPECNCNEGEECVYHPQTCMACAFNECVRKPGDGGGGTDCIACPAIYKMCDCKADEDCVRTPQTCKSCETVECRKRNSSEPPKPTETPSPPSATAAPTGGDGGLNCSNPVMCPAIYEACSCRADETCVRRSACDRCPWIECHRPSSNDTGGANCIMCYAPPSCPKDCKGTCVITPASCNSCGNAECRNDAGLRIGLDLGPEIKIDPDLALALFKKIKGAIQIGDTNLTVPPPTTSSSADSVSVTIPPPVEGTHYFSVPCDTGAEITLIFPGKNYSIPAKEWVVPKDGKEGECKAALAVQDLWGAQIVLGRPFFHSIEAAFRFNNDKAQAGFHVRNGSTTAAAAGTGSTSTSGALNLGLSMSGLLAALLGAALTL